MKAVAFYDIETRTLASDHPGGWDDIPNFGMSLGVVWDNESGLFTTFYDTGSLYDKLMQFDVVVSFNGIRFDNPIICRDAEALKALNDKSFDMLVELQKILGHRVKLDQLAEGTLGMCKSADGINAVMWWKAARTLRDLEADTHVEAAAEIGAEALLSRIKAYCVRDVRILRDIFWYGAKHGKVQYRYHGDLFTVLVDWPKDMFRMPPESLRLDKSA